MNTTSLILGLIVFGIVIIMTAAINYGAKNYSDWSDRRRRWTCSLLLLGGTLFSVYAYVMDYQLRVTTLHELVFKPTGSGVFETVFDVRAPGVEHSLLVHPIASGMSPADKPFRVHIELQSATDEALIDEEHSFELEKEYYRNSRRWFYIWDSTTIEFTPTQAGSHRLSISLLQHRLPEMHVRIADPTLTDGQRAPGY